MITLPPKTWEIDKPDYLKTNLDIRDQKLNWIILAIERITADLNQKELQANGDI